MWNKFVFLVAAFCVANGSVITINVFDDELETAVRQGVEDCNYRACEQLCRRLGFPGGACVNGRCDCDNFRDDKESTFVEELSSVRNTNCQDQTCNDNCKRGGGSGGVCIYNHCKCIKKTYAEELDTIIEELTAKNRNCQDQTCNDNCKRAGDKGGVCIYNHCKCIKKYAEDLLSYHKKVTSCNSITCKEQCQKIGFPNGICTFDFCKCINDFGKDTLSDVSDSALDTPTSKLTCTKIMCDRVCRILHFKGGSCVNGACKCYKNDALTALEDSQSEESAFQQAGTDYAEAEEANMILTKDEEEQPEDVSSCNPYKCFQKCIISGKHAGYCHHHKCHCI